MDLGLTITVWFFVGITLLLDGMLILGTGVYEVAHPPTKTVQFTLTPAKLSIYDLDMHRVVEPGTFDIFVGSSSVQTTETKLQVVAK